MILGKLNKIKKYYGDRLILDIENLEILEGDKIGLVGENGSGKSTLLKVLIKEERMLLDNKISELISLISFEKNEERKTRFIKEYTELTNKV